MQKGVTDVDAERCIVDRRGVFNDPLHHAKGTAPSTSGACESTKEMSNRFKGAHQNKQKRTVATESGAAACAAVKVERAVWPAVHAVGDEHR